MKLFYELEDLKEYEAYGTEFGMQQWGCITKDNKKWSIWTPKWALDSVELEKKLIDYINQENAGLINEIRRNILIITTMYLTEKSNQKMLNIDTIDNCTKIFNHIEKNDLSSITFNENGLIDTEDLYNLASELADEIYGNLEKW